MPRADAVIFESPGVVAVRQVSLGPRPGDLLLTAVATAVSAGTEGRCLKGLQPGLEPEFFPFVPGYAFVGRGEDGRLLFGSGTQVLEGANRGWGGHVGLAAAPESAWLPVPEGVSAEDAALAKLAAIAYRGVRLARPLPHETVAVFGLGPIGSLAARLHAATGARVVAFDPNPERRGLFPGESADPAERERLLPDGADVVVDATGHPAVVRESIKALRRREWQAQEPRARFVVQGSYPGDLAFDYHDAFFAETEMLFPRDSTVADARAALDMMARGVLDVSGLAIAMPYAQAPAAYAALAEGRLPGAVFQW